MPLANVYKNFRRYLNKAGIPHSGAAQGLLGHEGFEETAYYLKLTAEMYPSIWNGIKSLFPDLIQEVPYEKCEFY